MCLKYKSVLLHSSGAKAESQKHHCIKLISLLRNKLCHINNQASFHIKVQVFLKLNNVIQVLFHLLAEQKKREIGHFSYCSPVTIAATKALNNSSLLVSQNQTLFSKSVCLDEMTSSSKKKNQCQVLSLQHSAASHAFCKISYSCN